jgi:hypothetical protein
MQAACKAANAILGKSICRKLWQKYVAAVDRFHKTAVTSRRVFLDFLSARFP